jgi:hypothetical protein
MHQSAVRATLTDLSGLDGYAIKRCAGRARPVERQL